MSTIVLAVALAEFERWADIFEIDTDESTMTADEAKAFNTFRRKFTKRMQSGALTVAEDGALTYTPRGCDETLVFKEPTGAVLSARQKNDDDVQTARRVLAEWAGVKPVVFAEMPLSEFNFCGDLLGFFGGS